MPVIRLRRGQRTTAAQVELPAHQGEGAPQRARTDEWPKVNRAVVLLQPGQGEAGNWIAEIDLEHQETFVVAKADVVTGMKLFDEFVFEEQRFRFITHDMHIKVLNALDQGRKFEVPAHPSGRVEVLVHSLAQITRLADVNDRAKTV